MRKKTLWIVTTVITLSLSMLGGCGNQPETNSTPTEAPALTEAPISEATPTETLVPTPTETPIPAPTETSVPTQTETPTPTPTETPVPTPIETPVPTPTETPIPTPTETPIPTPTEPPHEHAYIESIIKEATCTEAGEKSFTCECGDIYTEAIEATGHNYETVANSAIKATCTADGKNADTKCSLCGDRISGAVIPAIGHNYGAYTYNNDATTEKDGTETAACSNCGDKITRTKEGTKLEPETHWYDGYEKHVWHDIGGYMFWMGDTQEEANDMAWSEEIQRQAAILGERYPDRSVYNMSSCPDGMPIALTSTRIDVPFWRPTFIWAGGTADAESSEPPQMESFDPINAEGLPFVPFQIYEEEDFVYFWYPVGSFYGYGKTTEQEWEARLESNRIIRERYNINNVESRPYYEKYYYKCSLGNKTIDGENYILYYKWITYVPGTH